MENKFIEKWKAKDRDELKRYRAGEFIEIVEGKEINGFNIDLYFRMIEKMIAFEDKIIVGMPDDTEVKCIIE